MWSTKEGIQTHLAQQPTGILSQAIRSGNQVFLSGQIGYNVSAGRIVLDSFEAQAEQAFSNVKTMALASGGTVEDIVKLNVFITDFKNFPTVNKVMEKYFRQPYPARSTVGVKSLPLGVDIEVEGIMILHHSIDSKL